MTDSTPLITSNHFTDLPASQWAPLASYSPDLKLRFARLHNQLRYIRKAPDFHVVEAPTQRRNVALYFVYSPTGECLEQHSYSLSKLSEDGLSPFIVIATQPGATIDPKFSQYNGLARKGLNGFDFSGYALGIHALLQTGDVENLLVMNDSIFGPFYSLKDLFEQSPFNCFGFTTSFAVEPHFQSYAFGFKQLDTQQFARLSKVFPIHTSYNVHKAVAFLQETQLARVCYQLGSVGSLWTPTQSTRDLTMADPFTLLEHGFPFFKRSIIGKFSDNFDQEKAITTLKQYYHPL